MLRHRAGCAMVEWAHCQIKRFYFPRFFERPFGWSRQTLFYQTHGKRSAVRVFRKRTFHRSPRDELHFHTIVEFNRLCTMQHSREARGDA